MDLFPSRISRVVLSTCEIHSVFGRFLIIISVIGSVIT